MKNLNKLFMPLMGMLLVACTGGQSEATVAETEETAESVRQKSRQEISPREIEGNAVQLFADDWFELAAGKEGDMNLMTIAWGTFGQLWNRPIVTVYVSSSRYTYQFMEKNDYFTISHFPASMREKLQYLGTVSGRDEDKVKGAGLTAEFTELGNPIFAESDLTIECRKIYEEPFDPERLQLEQKQWYEERGIGLHTVYVGEIVHVWKK